MVSSMISAFYSAEKEKKLNELSRKTVYNYFFMDESNDEVLYGGDAKRVYNELHIGRSMNTFIMQLNSALKDFGTFFSRVHSTSPFRNVECRCH